METWTQVLFISQHVWAPAKMDKKQSWINTKAGDKLKWLTAMNIIYQN